MRQRSPAVRLLCLAALALFLSGPAFVPAPRGQAQEPLGARRVGASPLLAVTAASAVASVPLAAHAAVSPAALGGFTLSVVAVIALLVSSIGIGRGLTGILDEL